MGRPDLTAPLRAKRQKIGQAMRQRRVCHFSKEPFNINGRLYSSLAIYHFDLKGKYQFIPLDGVYSLYARVRLYVASRAAADRIALEQHALARDRVKRERAAARWGRFLPLKCPQEQS
jgi:hypothetical protein